MFRLVNFLRIVMALLVLSLMRTAPVQALGEKAAAALQSGGHVVLMRHAQTVPGLADPAGFKLGDCATQRNLSEAGREDARRIGATLRDRGIAIGRVLSSPWCRCVDTVLLMLPGVRVEEDASLGSFVEIRDPEARRKALDSLRATIAAWNGPGNLLMVSHQATISALTGEGLAQGGMLIVKPKPGGYDLVAEEQP